MPALDRTLALAQMDDGAVLIAEDLELDVARRLDVLLDVHVGDAERRLGFPLRRLERVRELTGVADDAHPASAAAGRRLDDHRIADVLGDLERLLFAFNGSVAAGQNRDAGLAHDTARAGLVGHQPDHLWIGPDELDVAGAADFGEIRTFGKETVAGMNRI